MADTLNEQKGVLAAAEKAGIKDDLEDLRTEIDTRATLQREGREELERLVAQRAIHREGYRRKQSELQGFARALSKIQKEATVERLLPDPKSNARLAKLAVEIRQISDALTNDADEITEQPAEPNNN